MYVPNPHDLTTPDMRPMLDAMTLAFARPCAAGPHTLGLRGVHGVWGLYPSARPGLFEARSPELGSTLVRPCRADVEGMASATAPRGACAADLASMARSVGGEVSSFSTAPDLSVSFRATGRAWSLSVTCWGVALSCDLDLSVLVGAFASPGDALDALAAVPIGGADAPALWCRDDLEAPPWASLVASERGGLARIGFYGVS